MDIFRILKTKRSFKSVCKIVIVKLIKFMYKKVKFSDSFFSRKKIAPFKMNNDIFIKKNEIKNLGMASKEQIIKDAEVLLEHRFKFFSNDLYFLGNDIQWNKDYRTGYKWDDNYFSKIELVNASNDSDVKFPWELSRFQHLVTLGQAYVITNQEKYAVEVVSQINDWINKNKYNFSVNWTVAMEVSIRAVNWIQAINLIRDSKSLNDDFLMRFNKSLYKHLFFILNNLEKGFTTNNHYLSNIFGVSWIVVYISNSGKKSKLLGILYKLISNELVEELEYQIYSDGFAYEDSTAYHCFNLEMLLYSVIMLNENGFRVNEKTHNKLDAMVRALKVIINRDGTIPIFGDDDSGRFMVHNNYIESNLKYKAYLLDIYENYYVNRNLKLFFDKNHSIKLKEEKKLSLKDAGLFVLSNKFFHAHVKCGRFGLDGKGTHAHNDQLSIVLRVKGKEFLIDPGTGSYTGSFKIRNELRATSSHNTVSFEEIEQNELEYTKIFSMNEKTYAKFLSHNSVKFEGEHYGYKKDLNIIHRRKIILNNNNIQIIDTLPGLRQINKHCYINFILAEDIVVKTIKDKILLLCNDTVVEVTSDLDFRIDIINVSPQYGVFKKSNVIRFKSKKDINIINFQVRRSEDC